MRRLNDHDGRRRPMTGGGAVDCIALLVLLTLAACRLAPGPDSSSPYRGPTAADIDNAGGGAGGGM